MTRQADSRETTVSPLGDDAGKDSGRKKLLVVDAYNLFYRAYHALPPFSSPDGRPTNAVFGFARMVQSLLDELQPDYVAIARDLPGEEPSFREEILPEYKADRPPMPDDLREQIPLLERLADALCLPMVGVEGYEADDVMGALASVAEEQGLDTYLATGDKDAYQLVSDHTFVCASDRSLQSNVVLDAQGVEEKLGVAPSQVIDFKALSGDSSDNIKGISGVGPKRAAGLLEEFGSLDEVLENADKISNKRIREATQEAAEAVRRAKEVVTIQRDIDLPVDLDALERHEVDEERTRELFLELGFRSLLDRYVSEREVKAEVSILDPGDGDAIDRAVSEMRNSGTVGLIANMVSGRVAQLGMACSATAGYVLALAQGTGKGLFDGEEDGADLPEPVARMLADGRVRKICYDWKAILRGLPEEQKLGGVEDDALIAAHLLDHGERRLDFARIIANHLGQDFGVPEEPGDFGRAASRLLPLMETLRESLEEEALTKLYREIELPLPPILAEMEDAGIRLDATRLRELGQKLDKGLAGAEERIFELAGEEFTIGSPKQLQEVLFEKLELPRGRKTKTGYSTDAETLETLAEEHEIARAILEWRQLSKLRSTYVDSLLKLVDGDSGRVHTTFHQTAVVTGRLSSSDPNLQNIPIRSQWGREVRKCFVPPEGMVLLGCDYSQIELRILAHFSKDENLLEAFRENLDVHAYTASLLYDVDLEDVTREQRGAAKAVNFGIMYGMGSQRLARDMDMSRDEAKAFIERYFERYSGVKRFIDDTIEQARTDGYVVTLLGRRRNLPDINSGAPQARAAAERTAVNTPIQGTAADLIKMAMRKVQEEVADWPDAHMLLQVHDELVFEVPEGKEQKLAEAVIGLMESPLELDVPIVVDAKAGPSWGEMTALDT
ncbi:MAG: DNA polymerase I [Armatimonadia bacterium]|nr:DNA polymerase I [Armatimonadia bacterium]